ncbi:MAG TPA: MFS transporter [Pseudonocardia sp.]|nr:MFS transporter [Pseudonocardia sp.]
MTGPAGPRGTPFRLMLAATLLGFGGYALLLPVVPLWAARGGAGAFEAGATTGVLMLLTVGTQLTVPWLIARSGYRVVLAAGMVLLGAPAPLHALSADLGPVLAVSAVRGIGFGLLTVAGSALVAELVAPAAHGRAAARYGLAVGVPQLGLLPAGVAVVEVLGFPAVFAAAGIAPLLGALLVPAIRVPASERPDRVARLGVPDPRTRTAGSPDSRPDRPRVAPGPTATRARTDRDPHRKRPRPTGRLPGAGGPVLAMLGCSVAQGGLITFLPLVGAPAAVALALFGTAAGALVGRLLAGELVDRRGLGGRLLPPATLLTAAGMGVEVLGVGTGAGWVLVAGAVVVGIGFGIVQNDALTALFVAGGPAHYGAASAAWNIAYDAGTGLGAVGLGAVAGPFGFAAAFAVSGFALLVVAPLVTLGRRPGSGASPRRRAGAGRR